MYGDDANGSEVKLSEVVEAIAVLSFLPELATLHMHNDDMLLEDGPTAAETLAAHPPTSRVPRLHVLLLRTPRTADVPPLLPVQPVPSDFRAPGAVDAARQAALSLLTDVVGGDGMAAEYLLLTLLSKCALSIVHTFTTCVLFVLCFFLFFGEGPPWPCPSDISSEFRVHRRSQEGAMGVFSLNLYQPAAACKPGHTPPHGQAATTLAAQLPTLLQALLPRCCILRLDTDSVR